LPIALAAALLLALAGPSAQEAVRPPLTGIDHVAFRVSDAAATKRFYADTLRLHSSTMESRTVIDVGRRQRIVLEAGLPETSDERLSHVAFAVGDVTSMTAYLKGRGVDVLQPGERCTPMAIRAADPDGHVIEFVAARTSSADRIASPDRALSHRLLHVGVTVRDEEAAHRFYRDVLGFQEIWRGGAAENLTNWVNMRVPDGTDYVEYMLAATPPDRRQRGVMHHACLMVPDIQAAWEVVGIQRPASPVSTIDPPRIGRNRKWQLNLFDPDGTRIELMEPWTVR
jgi:lactoylglutathione lyase